jgi:hypothetical protein
MLNKFNNLAEAPPQNCLKLIVSPPAFTEHKSLRAAAVSYPLVLSSMGIAVLLLSGCGQVPEDGYEGEAVTESQQEVAIEDIAEASQAIEAETTTEKEATVERLAVENISGDSEQTLGSQVADIEIPGKTLVVNARADFKVADVVKSKDAIETLTRQQGGYVAAISISNNQIDQSTYRSGEQDINLTTYSRHADMTVRIPKAKVSEFMRQLQKQVVFLQAQEFSAQDVTLDLYREQLAAQLNGDMAAELSAERLNSDNEKEQGSNVESISATYAAKQQQQLAKLTQMDIADKVRFSTIALSFNQPPNTYKETTQNLEVLLEAEQPGFFSQAGEAFKSGWEVLKAVVLGIIQLWWLWALIALAYLLYKALRTTLRRLFKRNAARKPVTKKVVRPVAMPLNNSVNKEDDIT